MFFTHKSVRPYCTVFDVQSSMHHSRVTTSLEMSPIAEELCNAWSGFTEQLRQSCFTSFFIQFFLASFHNWYHAKIQRCKDTNHYASYN